ncbi:MAG: phosphatase PAP2 family protein [Verrucomicrobiales bacterium]|nr:phosphatase PAP2 family protein [Verrucomicrobiales bacterium]
MTLEPGPFKPAALILVVTLATMLPAHAHDAVVRWNRLALDAIRFGNTPPPAAARNLAILHLATFDAVNSLDGPYLGYHIPAGSFPLSSGSALPDASLAAAANRVLRTLWPQFAVTFDAEFSAQLLSLPGGMGRNTGVEWGRKVADALLRERDFDGANFGVDYRPASGPGRWQPTPALYASALLPQWPLVKPFGLARANQFRPAPPPALTSEGWARECHEVESLGGITSTNRSAEQTEIAWFWADGQGTESPPGHWNAVAAQVCEAHAYSLLESARLFALLNLALADAGIACWDAKYTYDWWRPVTAIRAADLDGNPETASDPTWAPLISTPPFPEHVSGHSTFSAAAATILAAVHGNDRFAFTLRSDGLFGVTRSYQQLSEAVAEAGMSRIYGGIHFRSANQEGQALGRSVAAFVRSNYLLPRAEAHLVIVREGRNLRLRWPAGATVVSAPTLDATPWQPVGGFGELHLQPEEGPTRFFKLLP